MRLPNPSGVYSRLGLGKKNGRDVGKVDAAEETGALVDDFESVLWDFEDFESEGEDADEVAGLPRADESSPANEGRPKLAKFANSELVRPILPKPPIPLRALMFGIPPNGIRSGLFLGSKPPSDKPDNNVLGLSPPKPDASDGKGRLPAPRLEDD